MAKKVTKKLGVKAEEKQFNLEVHLNDMVLKSKGKTLLEAVEGFINSSEFPFAVKTKVFLKYGKGDISRHKLLNLSSARTIFKRLRFDDDQARFLADKLEHELTY